MTPKEYILKDVMLNRSLLAERIGWNKTSMSLWLSGKGNIPLDKLERLESELRAYGYL